MCRLTAFTLTCSQGAPQPASVLSAPLFSACRDSGNQVQGVLCLLRQKLWLQSSGIASLKGFYEGKWPSLCVSDVSV